jgi:hypothetical protein
MDLTSLVAMVGAFRIFGSVTVSTTAEISVMKHHAVSKPMHDGLV